MKPRGIRNNNPLNIRRTADRWVGMCDEQRDAQFCEFTDFKYGYRAAFVILHRYMNVYKLRTMKTIIRQWCPYGDGRNNPDHYAETVGRLTGLEPMELLSFENRFQMMLLAIGMTAVECGTDIDWLPLYEAVAEGYDLAAKKLGYCM